MIIDGKQLAQDLRDQVKRRIEVLSSKPVLCDVVVGSDPVSLSFVRTKQRAAEEVGMEFKLVQLTNDLSTEQVIAAIHDVQTESDMFGLIVQLPLPKSLDSKAVLSEINFEIDVDLLNPKSSKKFYNNFATLQPPTAAAVLYILDSLAIDLSREKILIIGQGNLVGKPVTHLLKQRNLNVTTADVNTENISQLTSEATVIISGVGKAGLISGEMVQDGVIIIDAGTSEAEGVISGDVDFASVSPKARFITPVPGGVGPVTVAKLLENVVASAEAKFA